MYYNYGSSSWAPQGVKFGCFNLVGCSVNSPASCDDGWCTDTSYTFNESFVRDPDFDGFVEARISLVDQMGEAEVDRIEGLINKWVKEINEAGIKE